MGQRWDKGLLLRLAEVHMPSAGDLLIHQQHKPSEESNSIPFTKIKALLSKFDNPPTNTIILLLMFSADPFDKRIAGVE